MGTHRYNGFAWRFQRTPAVAHRPPPRLGEHSVEILSSLAGLSAAQINEMISAGISGSLLLRDETESNGPSTPRPTRTAPVRTHA
jgi:hypothetical protein